MGENCRGSHFKIHECMVRTQQEIGRLESIHTNLVDLQLSFPDCGKAENPRKRPKESPLPNRFSYHIESDLCSQLLNSCHLRLLYPVLLPTRYISVSLVKQSWSAPTLFETHERQYHHQCGYAILSICIHNISLVFFELFHKPIDSSRNFRYLHNNNSG